MISKSFLLVVFFGLAVAFPRGSSDERKSGLSIFDGSSTTIDKHNYLVGIVNNGSYQCAGTIVSEQWIMTLGECTLGVNSMYQLKVVAGSSDGVTGTSYSVSKIVPHPNYANAANFDYNYAMLRIDGTFSFGTNVGKVTLPDKAPSVGTTMTVAGYGDTNSMETEGGALKQATMKWIAPKSCQKVYSSYLTWTDNMACASSAKKMTLCNGDYGNAFVKDSVFYGMFSGGVSSGFCTAKAKAVLISNIFPVVDWITSTSAA